MSLENVFEGVRKARTDTSTDLRHSPIKHERTQPRPQALFSPLASPSPSLLSLGRRKSLGTRLVQTQRIMAVNYKSTFLQLRVRSHINSHTAVLN